MHWLIEGLNALPACVLHSVSEKYITTQPDPSSRMAPSNATAGVVSDNPSWMRSFFVQTSGQSQFVRQPLSQNRVFEPPV